MSIHHESKYTSREPHLHAHYAQVKSGHDHRHQLFAMEALLQGLPSLEGSPDAVKLKKAMSSFARATKWCFRVQHATHQAHRSKVVLRAATHLYMCSVDLENVSLTNNKGYALEYLVAWYGGPSAPHSMRRGGAARARPRPHAPPV